MNVLRIVIKKTLLMIFSHQAINAYRGTLICATATSPLLFHTPLHHCQLFKLLYYCYFYILHIFYSLLFVFCIIDYQSIFASFLYYQQVCAIIFVFFCCCFAANALYYYSLFYLQNILVPILQRFFRLVVCYIFYCKSH